MVVKSPCHDIDSLVRRPLFRSISDTLELSREIQRTKKRENFNTMDDAESSYFSKRL